MQTTTLAFVLHNHQPSGNLPEMFEQATRQAYLPFLQVLERFPRIKFTLHYSGTLLLWFKDHAPECIAILKTLLHREQIELLTGGLHEPILALIPERDRQAQIHAQNALLQELFGCVPTGAWLAERVWESDVVTTLSRAGVAYTLLDDHQFARAGLADAAGVYLTEHEGACLRIVPMNTALRHVLPFHSVESVIRHIRQHEGLLVVGDDGEKWGLSHESFAHCYTHGWLQQLFQALSEASDIHCVTLNQAVQHRAPRGFAYILSSSCEPEGYWRNHLVRYPSLNALHKRMLYTSSKLHACPRVPSQAYEHLWQAQAGDAYWHASKHLNFLRFAAYQNLIHTENCIEPRKYSWLDIEYHDINADGVAEVIAESHTMNLHFSPFEGGCLSEWDYREKAVNVTDGFAEQQQAYGCLIDHFLEADVSLEQFKEHRYLELGDFARGAFEASKYRNRVTMTRNGTVRGPSGIPVAVELKKSVRLLPKEHKLEIEYRIHNHGDWDIITRFGCRWNFGMLAGDAKDRYYWVAGQKSGSLDTAAEHYKVTEAGVVDEWQGLKILFGFEGREVDIWHYPRYAEGVYQSSVLMPLWDLDLPKGRSRKMAFSVHIEER